MPNPKPTQTPEFLGKQFKPKGAESLGKVIGVRFPLAIDAQLQLMADKTDFIRQAVVEKLEREKLLSGDVDAPVIEDAIVTEEAAPTPTRRRRTFADEQAIAPTPPKRGRTTSTRRG